MIRCKLCLLPDSRPDTAFVDGVCSACLAYARRPQLDWEGRRKQLLEILDRHNGRCIIPSSGGKDSHYQVLTLLELGAEVTIVTATTCHLTTIGRRNIDNLARYADTIEIMPNREVRAKLNRLGLKLVGDISWPEHCLIYTIPFQAAMDLKIPLVFYGENSTTEYGGPDEQRQSEQRVTRQWAHEFSGYGGMRPQDTVGIEGIRQKDMRLYIGPNDIDLEKAGVEVYFLGQFLPWDSRANATKAIQHGFETALPCAANWWNFENLDNAHTGLHDFFMYLKYGYGRACAQLSVDIRTGYISRNDAWAKLQHLDGVFPEVYAGVPLDDMLDKIGMSRQQLQVIIDDYSVKAA